MEMIYAEQAIKNGVKYIITDKNLKLFGLDKKKISVC